MSTDLDCNQVAYYTTHPDLSDRCTMPEGHDGSHWFDTELMHHKHRKPIQTFTDPFDVVPLGGRHRRPVVAVPACAEVRRRLAVAVEAAAVDDPYDYPLEAVYPESAEVTS